MCENGEIPPTEETVQKIEQVGKGAVGSVEIAQLGRGQPLGFKVRKIQRAPAQR